MKPAQIFISQIFSGIEAKKKATHLIKTKKQIARVKMMKHFVLIIFIFVRSNEAFWTCSANGTTEALQFKWNDISGNWFEIMRSPENPVPACAQITLTNITETVTISLQLNYVNNANQKWHHKEENLVLPWNETIQNNTLVLKYGERDGQVDVTFKVLELYRENFLIVCGLAQSVSSVSLMKVLSRERNISESDNQDLLEHLRDKYEIRSSQVGLVYQAEDCNRSVRHLSYHVIFTILFNKIFTDILYS